MIVVIDEPADAGFKIARQVVVLQQDAVLEGLMPAFDLALCLRETLGYEPPSMISAYFRAGIQFTRRVRSLRSYSHGDLDRSQSASAMRASI
jgi:hypothetical protein